MGSHLKEWRQPVKEEAGFCDGGRYLLVAPYGHASSTRLDTPHSLSSVFVLVSLQNSQP